MLTRRVWISAVGAVAAGCGTPRRETKVAPARGRTRILLRPGGTPDDFGDEARTQGWMRMLAVHIPEAEVALEPAGVFDFVLYVGSAAWREEAPGGTPYGVAGLWVAPGLRGPLRTFLKGAEFVFARDSGSLAALKRTGFGTGFAPDAGFGVHALAEPAAREYLERNGLEQKKFLVVWTDGPRTGGVPKLRDAAVAWVRRTGGRLLMGPGGTGIDGLPDDVKARAVRRETAWQPGEAASVFRRAVAVVACSDELLTVAAANDTPVVWLHGHDDSASVQMWKDIGLGRWLVDDEGRLTPVLLSITEDYAGAQVDVHEAVIYARKLLADVVGRVRERLYPANAKKC